MLYFCDGDKQPLGLVVTQDFPYHCFNQTSDKPVLFMYPNPMDTRYFRLWNLTEGELCTGMWDVRYDHGNGRRLEETSGRLVWSHVSNMPPAANTP